MLGLSRYSDFKIREKLGKFLPSSSYSFPCRSDLRSYLLDRGVIAPTSTREQLVSLARQDYDAVRKSVNDATGTHKSLLLSSRYGLFSGRIV